MMTKFKLSKRIKYLRFCDDYSQVDLAKKAKLSQSTIAQIESGRKDPSFSTIKKIAKVFHMDLSSFFLEKYK